MCTCDRHRTCRTHQEQAEMMRDALPYLRDMMAALAEEA